MSPSEEPLNKRISNMRIYHKFLPRFIVALSISNNQSVAEACRRVKHATAWWFTLPEEIKQMAIELADELYLDPLLQAREIIGNGVVQAAAKKMQLVNSSDERVADKASTYVLDKVLGKPATQTNKHVEVEIVSNLPWGKKS